MEFSAKTMLLGYANGIFPMALDANDERLYWFEPEKRGIIPLDAPHMSKSLQKFLRNCPFRLSLNQEFALVVNHCAAPYADRKESWINQKLKTLYLDLHQQGFAHSIEVWQDDEMVGGLFGVSLHGAFFGESMFSRKSNASKIALFCLILMMKRQGLSLLDTQYLTPHLASLGGIEITREDYQEKLQSALALNVYFDPTPQANIGYKDLIKI